MISNRTRASECVNTQNTKGNHVADGANFLMQTGLEYYTAASQGISAAWDWYKIPGITIDYNDVPLYCWNPPLGITDFVGGVTTTLLTSPSTTPALIYYIQPTTKFLFLFQFTAQQKHK